MLSWYFEQPRTHRELFALSYLQQLQECRPGVTITTTSSSVARSASQEILSHLLWNLMLLYNVHKILAPIPISSQMNPFHTLQTYFPKIYFSSILPSIPRSSKSQPKFCTDFSSSPCILHVCLSHIPWFNHSNNNWWKVQIMELLIMKFSLASSCHPS